jgi:hypothetical protein
MDNVGQSDRLVLTLKPNVVFVTDAKGDEYPMLGMILGKNTDCFAGGQPIQGPPSCSFSQRVSWQGGSNFFGVTYSFDTEEWTITMDKGMANTVSFLFSVPSESTGLVFHILEGPCAGLGY